MTAVSFAAGLLVGLALGQVQARVWKRRFDAAVHNRITSAEHHLCLCGAWFIATPGARACSTCTRAVDTTRPSLKLVWSAR